MMVKPSSTPVASISAVGGDDVIDVVVLVVQRADVAAEHGGVGAPVALVQPVLVAGEAAVQTPRRLEPGTMLCG